MGVLILSKSKSSNKQKLFKLPLNSDEMMFYESLLDNSGLSVTNTWIASFYRIYFYNKLLSIIQVDGLPDSIDERFFKNRILTKGYLGIFETEKYGVIASDVSLSDLDIYYNPTTMTAVNPKFVEIYKRKIDVDSALVKLSPNFETVLPIVYYYADLMAVAVQGIDSNVLNSKLAYVFACENQTDADSFKKMFDEIANGYPAVFVDKKLFDDEGNLKVQMFNNNINNTFIADKLMKLKTDIENEFNAFIGLNTVNTEKKERLITPEVELSNNNNKLLIELWRDTINDGLDKANELYNLNMRVTLNINTFTEKGSETNVSTEA